MQPERSHDYGLYRHVNGTHIGRPSTNIDRRAPDVLDHARVDETTRTKSCPRVTHIWGPIGVTAAHVTPRKIRLVWSSRAASGAHMNAYVADRRAALST